MTSKNPLLVEKTKTMQTSTQLCTLTKKQMLRTNGVLEYSTLQ